VSTPHLPVLPDQISFASELVKARAEISLTQAQLADKSGLSISAIKSYESGRNMPGTRELRELCQALQISPNKLLFGTELPFEQRTVANMLVDGDTDNHAAFRIRLALIANMLASDERLALLTLANSIAVARHGEEKVKEILTNADVMAGIGRAFSQATRDALTKEHPVDPLAVAEQVEDFMRRQGHVPTPKKTPKK
jgi:transcriptional regulator with XRE-family HTH domain